MVDSVLTGADVKRMIQGAAGWVALHREALNLINVYPVPDGDTGANLGRTLAAASEAMADVAANASAREIATTAASAALLGGRGSSGVIGAQWLRGFAAGLSEDGDASLTAAFASAAEAARNAVTEPRDGTMISVAADTATAVQDADTDLLAQLQRAVEAAYESVEHTPEQNPVLKDAGVVDAGARGLEFMLRGMAGALAGEPIPDVPAELGAIDPGWLARRLDDGGEFDGFCTELVVANVEDIDGLREVLSGDDETVMLAPDGDDLDGPAQPRERPPEPPVRVSPGAERGRSLVARVHVDERRAGRVQRDGQLDGEVAAGVAGGTPVDSNGEEGALDSERLERGDLLVLGRQPRQVRVLDHVVEREQAAHQHLGRSVPPMPDVFGSERPVDAAREDPAHPPDAPDARHGLLGGEALGDQGVHDAPHLFGMRVQKPHRLRAGEHAAVKAHQGDPPGMAARPAELLHRPFPSLQMGDHRPPSVTSARSAWR